MDDARIMADRGSSRAREAQVIALKTEREILK